MVEQKKNYEDFFPPYHDGGEVSFDHDYALMLASELRMIAYSQGEYGGLSDISLWTQGVLVKAASVLEQYCVSSSDPK